MIVVGDVDREAVVDDDQEPLLGADQPVAGAAAAGVRRAGAARHALRRRDRQGNDRRPRSQLSNLRPARNQGTVGGYRDIMIDQLFGAMLGARLDELSQRENPPFLRAGGRSPPVPDAADQGRGAAPGARRERRRRARPRRAGHRARSGSSRFGVHRDRARAREAGAAWPATSASSPRARTASRPAAPTSTRATSCRTKRCRRSGRSSRSTAASCPAITLAEINALGRGLVPRAQPAGHRVRAGSGRRRAADQAQLAAAVKTALRQASSRPTSTRPPARR